MSESQEVEKLWTVKLRFGATNPVQGTRKDGTYIHDSRGGMKMRYWGLRITFCDAENNQFLSLGGAAWATKRERDANFATIPKATSHADSPFIVDVEDDDDIVDDRLVTPTTVEALLGRPVQQLIEEAQSRELSI